MATRIILVCSFSLFCSATWIYKESLLFMNFVAKYYNLNLIGKKGVNEWHNVAVCCVFNFLFFFAGNGSQMSEDETELEPLELVWAKCRGYPSYPALVILYSAQNDLKLLNMMGSFQQSTFWKDEMKLVTHGFHLNEFPERTEQLFTGCFFLICLSLNTYIMSTLQCKKLCP